MEKNISELPEELLVEILSWLPVKSLLRCRCVKRSWLSLISNPAFITKHCRKQKLSSGNSSSLISFHIKPGYRNGNKSCIARFSIDLHRETKEHVVGDVLDYVHIPFLDNFVGPPRLSIDYLNVLGSSDGVICICIGHEKVAFWNPSMRQFKIVPPSISGSRIAHCSYTGFGFSCNDIKLVRFFHSRSTLTRMWYTSRIELYTSSANSWRLLPVNSFDKLSFLKWPGEYASGNYLNGVCHWLADVDGYLGESSLPHCGCVILCFNMTTEAIRIMSVPRIESLEFSAVDCKISFTLYNDEYVALLVHPKYAEDKWFDLWVMNEYGNKDSWSKQLRIEPLSGIDRVIGFRKSINGLFLVDDEGNLVLYNTATQKIQELHVQGMVEDFVMIVDFVESLVPVNGTQEENAGPIIHGDIVRQMFEATSNGVFTGVGL